jgi:hypothetical protein
VPDVPKYTKQITVQPVGEAPLPVGAADIAAEAPAAGAERLGVNIARLGEQLLQVKTAEDVAQGTAEYNNAINEYNLSLKDKSPEDYLEANEEGELDLPAELKEKIGQISVGKTGFAARNLQNKFKVWNEANRASIAILAARDKSAEIRRTAPDILAGFAQRQDDKGAEEYISEITKLTGIQSAEELTLLYGKIKDEAEIFRATNLASDFPTLENIDEARRVIEEKSATERDKFYNLQRLRSLSNVKATRRNEAFNATAEAQALQMVNDIHNGLPPDKDILPELEDVRQMFIERAGNLAISDGVTYDFMLDKINQGTYFTPLKLVDSYASGLSTDEYEELVSKNQENAPLSTEQRNDLAIYNKHIGDKESTILRQITGKISIDNIPSVKTALDRDTQSIRSTVKRMVINGDKSGDIYDTIEAHYIKKAEARDITRHGLWRVFLPRAYEIDKETRELTGVDDRFETIITLLKSGDSKAYERAQELLRRWNE